MSLNSTSVIKIVDLLCEGQIEAIVGGNKGIFLNDTAIQDDKGNFNFEKKDVKHMHEGVHDLGGKIDKIYWALLATVGAVALLLLEMVFDKGWF